MSQLFKVFSKIVEKYKTEVLAKLIEDFVK